ncbi:MAG TPA: lysylphosphatidylglycerol synthase transmembrane domain-containing protein [Methylomirabilota bacterium]|nr:lysylphosphatidylglycerol synthase transmembrane domain-containing protein [Methylomirabilota bacterium]
MTAPAAPSRGRLAKIVLGVAVSGALLVYVFWNVDPREVGARLASTHWGFLAASIVLNLLSVWIRSWRWYYLFPPGSQPSHLFNALMIGYMGNNLLPLRAGEVVRVYIAARHGPRFWTTVATLIVERVLDGLAVGVILAALFLTLPVPPELRWPAFLFLSADAMGLAALVVIAVAPGWCSAVIRALFGRWEGVERRLLDVLGTMSEGLRGVRARRHVVPIMLSSAGIWLVLAVAVWAGLRAAHLDLPLAASFAVMAFMGLGVSLPSSPGFIGVIQAATVLALALFSVPRLEALSFSLLFHAAQYFPVTIYGLVLLLVEQVSLSEATRGAGAAAVSAPR